MAPLEWFSTLPYTSEDEEVVVTGTADGVSCVGVHCQGNGGTGKLLRLGLCHRSACQVSLLSCGQEARVVTSSSLPGPREHHL